MQIAPYGTWQSNISAEQVATNSKSFFHTVGDGDYVYNVEMRPQEQGRHVIVRYNEDGKSEDVLPSPFSARTRVHEYGGRSFTVKDDIIYFVNYSDQNLYSMAIGSMPQKLTSSGLRFAELTVCKHGLLAVAEQHNADKTTTNTIALINLQSGEITTLVSGSDFYAFPTLNSDETKLAWVSWNHPNMPWDATQLAVADMQILMSDVQDDIKRNSYQYILKDSVEQAFYQPQWLDHDNLIFISDYNWWWNLYMWNHKGDLTFPLQTKHADFAKPLWNLGVKTWGLVDDKIVCIYLENGISKLAAFNPTEQGRVLTDFELPFSNIDNLTIHNDDMYFIGSSAILPSTLVKLSMTGKISILAEATKAPTDTQSISVAQSICFAAPNSTGQAYAYFYPPVNSEYCAEANSSPPLIVFIHGGPTSAATNAYNLEKQFWTSRGFAVVDVNYAGSSGYGREYRKALQREDKNSAGNWGKADVNDCIACVQYLIAQNLIDANMVFVRGRSAGGFTTLSLLAASKVFKAGACYYGVTDILGLAQDTHKFESHYMEQLVGALPKFENLYKQRSPINNVEQINVPLLVLQGDEDQVVVQAQSDSLVSALEQRGITVEYKIYKGEQHGFRKAETIIDALNTECNFYLDILYPEHKNEKKNINKLRL